MPDKNKSVLEKANVEMRKGDYEGFLSWCTEDTEWTFVGDQTLRGKDAVRNYIATEYKVPPKFKVAELIEEGNFVIALGDITVLDEDGAEVEHKYCDVWKLREGKLAELKAFVIKPGKDQ